MDLFPSRYIEFIKKLQTINNLSVIYDAVNTSVVVEDLKNVMDYLTQDVHVPRIEESVTEELIKETENTTRGQRLLMIEENY